MSRVSGHVIAGDLFAIREFTQRPELDAHCFPKPSDNSKLPPRPRYNVRPRIEELRQHPVPTLLLGSAMRNS